MSTLVPFWVVEPRHVQVAMLALLRLSGLLVLAPPVHAPLVPVPVRVALAFALLFLVWADLAPAAPPVASDPVALAGLAAGELGLGLALGFAARLVVATAGYAAELVAFQMGFGLAALLDPAHQESATVLTRLLDWTVLILFLALDGHHLLLGAAVESFRLLPPGRPPDLAAAAVAVVPLGGRLVGVGMALVAPVLGVLFLANLALVLANRAVPALNLMAVGFPVLILLGLGMVIVNLDLLGGLMGAEIRGLEGVLGTLLRSLAHGR